MFELYLRHEYAFAASQLILAMLGIGATFRVSELVAVVRVPKGLAAGFVTQLLLAPIAAVCLAWSFDVEAGIAVGLVLVASVPGGSLSNLVTFYARANTALSVSLTTITTLGCLFTTPLLLGLLASTHLPHDFEMPLARVALEIGFCLLVPLAVGMSVAAILPGIKDGFSRWCIRASLFVILCMAVGTAGAGRIDASAFGWKVPALMFLLAGIAQLAGIAAARAIGLPSRDRVAIGIEATVRNTNLALLIKASLFPVVAGVADPIADGAFFVALLYGGIGLAVALPISLLHRYAWSMRRVLSRLARAAGTDSVPAFVHANRNSLVCLPFVFALISTRWEWENDWGIWSLALLLCGAGIVLRGRALSACPYGPRWKSALAAAGPYAIVRHPVYWGDLLIVTGATVASELVWLLPLVLGWSFAVYSASALHEERAFREKYGDAYQRYLDDVPRWIPQTIGLGQPWVHPDPARFRGALFNQSSRLLVLTPFVLKELNFLGLWLRV